MVSKKQQQQAADEYLDQTGEEYLRTREELKNATPENLEDKRAKFQAARANRNKAFEIYNDAYQSESTDKWE